MSTHAQPSAASARPPPCALGRWGEVVRELALVGAAALCYFGVRNATVGSAPEAFANAARVERLERALSIAWEAAIQGPLIGHRTALMLVNWVYIWGHWPVIATVAVYLFWRHRRHFRLLRNAMFVSGAIGFVFFAFFPVAPPRLVDPNLIDTVTLYSHSYRALQPPGLTNQFAAFPSLHFGWNLLVGVVLWSATTNVLLRLAAVVGPTAMAVAVVATANHFLLDLAGGAAVVAVGLGVAWLLAARRGGYTRPSGLFGGPSRRQRSCTVAGRGARGR